VDSVAGLVACFLVMIALAEEQKVLVAEVEVELVELVV
jgi:hypothetical protein